MTFSKPTLVRALLIDGLVPHVVFKGRNRELFEMAARATEGNPTSLWFLRLALTMLFFGILLTAVYQFNLRWTFAFSGFCLLPVAALVIGNWVEIKVGVHPLIDQFHAELDNLIRSLGIDFAALLKLKQKELKQRADERVIEQALSVVEHDHRIAAEDKPPASSDASYRAMLIQATERYFDFFKSYGLMSEDKDGGFSWYFQEAKRRHAEKLAQRHVHVPPKSTEAPVPA